MIKTTYDFTLPNGYVDIEGVLHTKGYMRLATDEDEILSIRDPRVEDNFSYITIIILSRVIVKLGDLPSINISIIEALSTEDLSFLQGIYKQINQKELPDFIIKEPKCLDYDDCFLR